MGEREDPSPGEHDLVVEVHAAALNPVDWKVLAGGLGERPAPFVLGFDVSGVVREVGSKVEGFAPGDEIYASPSLARDGALAGRVLVDARCAAARPTGLDHGESAAIPLVTLTAWEALHDHVGIREGETVLIHAGGGGVGHVAIQLAKLGGCRVLTTASRDDSKGVAREAGADVVIDYKAEDVIERVRKETNGEGCPVVFDTVGGDAFERSLDCLALNGRLVTIVMNTEARPFAKLFPKNAALHFEFMGMAGIHGIGREAQATILRRAASLVDEGKLRPHVGRTVSLEEASGALRDLKSGHATGKYVVKIR
jgi:NADPH2:quinone reductase